MKRLLSICLLISLIVATSSALTPNDNNLCCDFEQVVDSAPQQCLTEADLIGGNWVEEFDANISTAHRIFVFSHSNVLQIRTVFQGGFVESEVTSWSLHHHQMKNYLTINDPVLGEVITYEVKATKEGIQLREVGIDEPMNLKYAEYVSEADRASF